MLIFTVECFCVFVFTVGLFCFCVLVYLCLQFSWYFSLCIGVFVFTEELVFVFGYLSLGICLYIWVGIGIVFLCIWKIHQSTHFHTGGGEGEALWRSCLSFRFCILLIVQVSDWNTIHPPNWRILKNLCWTRQIVFNLLDVFSGFALVKASMDSGIDVRICKFCWFCLKDKKRKREQEPYLEVFFLDFLSHQNWLSTDGSL